MAQYGLVRSQPIGIRCRVDDYVPHNDEKY